MGDNPPHGSGPGGFSVQVVQTDYRETYPAASGRNLGVPPIVGVDYGGEVGGSGGVCTEKAYTAKQYI